MIEHATRPTGIEHLERLMSSNQTLTETRKREILTQARANLSKRPGARYPKQRLRAEMELLDRLRP